MRRVVIVGAGIAGLRTAEALRRAGYDGGLELIGDEPELPYDRPPLSKEVLLGTAEPDSVVLRSSERLEQLRIAVRTGRPVTSLDVARREVVLAGAAVGYDALVIATGCSARRVPALAGIPGVITLRTLADARRLRERLQASRRIAILGGGFIGGEVASAARARGVEAIVVEQERAPGERVFGSRIGDALTALHRAHGTVVRCGTSVAAATPTADGRLGLRLTSGDDLDVDLLVVGVGAVPNTAWLEGSGLRTEGGVHCDRSLRAAPGVFAVGDVAAWPNDAFDRVMRVEHWTNAVEQARHAAANLLAGCDRPYLGSNYFWSDQYGVRLQFAGVASGEPELLHGNLHDGSFVACYRDGARVAGAFAMAAAERFASFRALVERRASWDEAIEEAGAVEPAAASD